MNDDGTVRPLSDLDPGQKAALQLFEVSMSHGDGLKTQTYRIRCWDKLKAIELLAKHLGLFDGKASGNSAIVELRWGTPEPRALPEGVTDGGPIL